MGTESGAVKKLHAAPRSVSCWCERGDSNPHGFTRQILSLVRLPIPPLSHRSTRQWSHCSVRLLCLHRLYVWGRIQEMCKRAMARKSNTMSNGSAEPQELKDWREIAAFLGEPTSVVQRWASEGMPGRRQGRFVSTTRKELNDWLGKQSGKPVHVVTGNTDLTSELKGAVSFARQEK